MDQEDVEGRGRGLLHGIILTFASISWGKAKNKFLSLQIASGRHPKNPDFECNVYRCSNRYWSIECI
jgi:hypothetical protein